MNTMDLEKKLLAYIKEENLFTTKDRLLLGVSGGMDSVVLTHLLHGAGYPVEIAHVNFSLRGDESERDEIFVQQLAANLGTPFHHARFDTKDYARSHKISIQEAARDLRYAWFRQLLEKHTRLRYMLTAHQSDDNVETVLMNLFKGTGMAGLRGIQPVSGPLRRPLLFATRKEIMEYAVAHDIHYVEDSSNLTDKYTRNFFRLRVIPMVEEMYPSALDNMRRNIGRFRDAEGIYSGAIAQVKKKILLSDGAGWKIPVEKLRRTPYLDTLIYETFSGFGFTTGQMEGIRKLMDSETGKILASSSHRVLKNRNWLLVTPLPVARDQFIVVEGQEELIAFDERSLHCTVKKFETLVNIPDNQDTACLDADELSFPWIIRKWKTGDYFYPLGMAKKKKLARFFIDNKLSLTEKENTWVLESGGRIVWVIGRRIDDRFRLQPHTRNMVILRLQSGKASKMP